MLGAGTWQVPWIRKAVSMGIEVCATDWSSQAEGKPFAHHFEAIDLKDKEKTLQWALEHQINGVLTAADIGVPTAAYVAEKMGLRFHSELLALRATNKYAMRQHALEIGLPGPEFYCVSSDTNALISAGKLGFPLLVKPVDSQSSRGVSVVNNKEELLLKFSEAMQASISGRVMLEEMMTGTEGSVEALVHDGKPYILGVCDKIKSALPYRYDLELNYPGSYTPSQQSSIIEFVEKLVTGFEIKKGVIHIEIMVSGDKVQLIEFAVRGCGSKVITHLMPAMNAFDVMGWVIENAFETMPAPIFQSGGAGVLKFIMLSSGRISKLHGVEAMKNSEGVLDADLERKEGDILGVVADGRSRPGYLLAVAENRETLNQRVQNALNKLEVVIV
jgi:formate-dependent phosphoribosylglycinamide formyltransferase (GAR transformylase)